MSFSSLTYLAFFIIVLTVLGVVRSARVKRAFLLVASYVFYGWLDWRLAALLAAMTLLNHAGARWVAAGEPHRRARVSMVVAADLLILGVFKYLGFFVVSASGVLKALSVSVPIPQIVLPLGISFITFQVIAYVVDVYRRDLEPVPLFDVALLVAFFPHLVAGPILQPRQFLPQLGDDIVVSKANVDAGVQQFVFGLAKKILVADTLAAFVNPVMTQPQLFSAATLRLAALAYAVQLYADFSGYSDMAIGSARCMGFNIPPNFASPYTSRSITEFWRRWHISLSTWLRRYLYFPLGGNRKGKMRQALNLLVVMLLAGLWHGASWNFVVWGGLHGAALVVHKVWSDRTARWDGQKTRPLAVIAGWVLTMGFVVVAWIFFRIQDLPTAWSVVVRLFGFGESGGLNWYATSALLLVPGFLGLDFALRRLEGASPQVRLATFKGAFVATLLLIAFALFWPTAATPFIYFRF